MKRFLQGVCYFITILGLFIVVKKAYAEEFVLKELYGIHQHTIYALTNLPCPFEDLVESGYLYTAKAITNGDEYKKGCFKPKDMNDIYIKFIDNTVEELPANLFLGPQGQYNKIPKVPEEDKVYI